MKQFVDLTPFREPIRAGHRILTPGLRLARQLIDAWVRSELDAGDIAREPCIQTVDAWLEALWCARVEAGEIPVRRMLTRLEERVLWQRVVDSDDAQSGEFRLLQTRSAAERAMESRTALLLYAEDPDSPDITRRFDLDPDCSAFRRWQLRFEAILRTDGLTTRVDAYRELLTLPVARKETVVLGYCLSLPPLTRRVLEHLAEVRSVGVPSPAAVPFPARRFIDRRAELADTARWAAQRHREGQGSTAVILLDMKRDRPDLDYFLREQFDCLDARYNSLPVNFSTGMSLAETPMYRDALLALGLPTGPQSRSRLLTLLRSPYLIDETFCDEPDRLALIQALMELQSDPVEFGDLVHVANRCNRDGGLARLLTALRSEHRREVRRSLAGWADVFRDCLRRWQWPSRTTLDSIEYQQLERLERSFDLLCRLASVVGEVSYSQALGQWASCLGELVFQPKTEHTAVQVLGPLEAVGLQFDAVRVCGAQSGVLPRRPTTLPFIPVGVQKALGMPQVDSALLMDGAMALIASWRATHSEVIFSCHANDDGGEQLPSPLLDILGQADDAPDRPRCTEPKAVFETVDEDLAVPVGPDGDVPYGGGATVITNQSNCPFRAWVIHRLGPADAPSPALGLTPGERGSIVHEALHHIWSELKGLSALRVMTVDEREDLVVRGVRAALQIQDQKAARTGLGLRQRAGSACLDLEAERVQTLLLAWLSVEAGRSEDFVVVEGERKHRLQLGALELTLRPDRVDAFADGRKLVIDYKTGRVSRSRWLGQRPGDPQLPLYLLLDDSVAGIAFASLRPDKLTFDALGEGLGLAKTEKDLASQLRSAAGDVTTWPELRLQWREVLENLADEWVRGYARIDPQPGACRYCQLASVCRIGVELTEDAVTGEALS